MTVVINQLGKYVYGEYRDLIVREVNKENHIINTVYGKVTVQSIYTDADGERIIKVVAPL